MSRLGQGRTPVEEEMTLEMIMEMEIAMDRKGPREILEETPGTIQVVQVDLVVRNLMAEEMVILAVAAVAVVVEKEIRLLHLPSILKP